MALQHLEIILRQGAKRQLRSLSPDREIGLFRNSLVNGRVVGSPLAAGDAGVMRRVIRTAVYLPIYGVTVSRSNPNGTIWKKVLPGANGRILPSKS